MSISTPVWKKKQDLADAAHENEHLASMVGSSQAVARLVGGSDCVHRSH